MKDRGSVLTTRGTILARPSPSCAYDDVSIFLLHSAPLERCHDTKDLP